MLDLKGFVAPVNNYEGLYQVSNDLERNKQREALAKDKAAANQASMAKFLVDYTNPKDFLSGSPTDVETTKGLHGALIYGTQLAAQKGMTHDQLLSVLAPIVGEISQRAITAKNISANIKNSLSDIPETAGYDKMKLEMLARKNAFFNLDGTRKALDEINPNVDYVTETIKTNPTDVTTNKGIDEWLKGQQRVVNSNKVKHYNERGGYDLKNVKTNAYDWAVPDTDIKGVNNRKFVPVYDEATDNGQPLLHDFPDGKGGFVTAPVRMIKDNLFKTIMANSPGTADWVRGQVMQHIKDYKDADGNPIDINSTQASNIAKAILYDELKTRGLGGMEDVVETKPTQIRNVTNIKVGGSEVPVIDVYNPLRKIAEDHLDQSKYPTHMISKKDGKIIIGGVPVNSLNQQQKDVVLKEAKSADDTIKSVDDVYIKLIGNDLVILRVVDDFPLTTLTPTGTNMSANKPLGQKSVQKSAIQSKGKGTQVITQKQKIAGF